MLDIPVLTSWTNGRIVILGGKLQSPNSCVEAFFSSSMKERHHC